ncbi:hypothetical protein BGZ50_008448, partial [Haplosporangium sp. Z 11]
MSHVASTRTSTGATTSFSSTRALFANGTAPPPVVRPKSELVTTPRRASATPRVQGGSESTSEAPDLPKRPASGLLPSHLHSSTGPAQPPIASDPGMQPKRVLPPPPSSSLSHSASIAMATKTNRPIPVPPTRKASISGRPVPEPPSGSTATTESPVSRLGSIMSSMTLTPHDEVENTMNSSKCPVPLPPRPRPLNDPAKNSAPIVPTRPEYPKHLDPTPSTQQNTPPPIPSRSGSQLLQRIQNQHAGEKSAPLPPSKPPRISVAAATKVQTPSPAMEADPMPPSLPRRPTLPARPTPPPRPSLPQRPELPQRPTLPKRPQQVTSQEHHSTSKSSSTVHSSFSATRLSSNNQGHQTSRSSSSTTVSYKSSSSSSSCSSSFRAGENAVAALGRSTPVVTAEFNGERLDLNTADFSVQDDHAKACPKSEEESVARLSYYLTSAFPGDQVAQLRAIFSWIGNNIIYNFTGFLSGQLGDNSAEAVLRTKTGVCAGFANLFEALAAPQQLGVSQVTGVARGYGYAPGDDSLGGAHAWNAVTINGECLLIDSTWGSGPICPKVKAITKGLVPHYFLVRPEHLIYSHWPSRPQDQFLDPPVHVDVYRALPHRTSFSWSLGIEPEGATATHTVKTDNDYFEVEVLLKKRSWDGAVPLLFTTLEWTTTGQVMTPVCHWTREDDQGIVMTIKCFCPSTGSGSLKIAGRAAGEVGLEGPMALAYRIVNEGTGENAQPMMQTYHFQDYSYSILEPITAQVQSGVMQTIRVKVFNVSPGIRPDIMTQVEHNVFEVQKVLRPGQYKIACNVSTGGMGALGIFDA